MKNYYELLLQQATSNLDRFYLEVNDLNTCFQNTPYNELNSILISDLMKYSFRTQLFVQIIQIIFHILNGNRTDNLKFRKDMEVATI